MTSKSTWFVHPTKAAAIAVLGAMVVGFVSPTHAQFQMGPREQDGTTSGSMIGGALGGMVVPPRYQPVRLKMIDYVSHAPATII